MLCIYGNNDHIMQPLYEWISSKIGFQQKTLLECNELKKIFGLGTTRNAETY